MVLEFRSIARLVAEHGGERAVALATVPARASSDVMECHASSPAPVGAELDAFAAGAYEAYKAVVLAREAARW
jgi:hypothetical protein